MPYFYYKENIMQNKKEEIIIQTKCTGCGKTSPIRTDICDKCGGVKFVPLDKNETKSIGEIIDGKKEEERLAKQKLDVEKAEEKKVDAEEKTDVKETEVKEDKKDKKKKDKKEKKK